MKNSEIRKIRNRLLKNWHLSIKSLIPFLNKQFEETFVSKEEKLMIVDFFHRYLKIYQNRFGTSEELNQGCNMENIGASHKEYSKYLKVNHWVIRKKIALAKEIQVSAAIASLGAKEWVHPDFEIMFLRNEIKKIKDELESEYYPDSLKNPHYQVIELFKTGEYPDLYESNLSTIIAVEAMISFNDYLNERLRYLEYQTHRNDILINAVIKAEKDEIGNITVNVPMEIVQKTVREMVDKEQEKLSSLMSVNKMPELLTRKEVAKLLGITVQTLYVWTNQGIIQAERIGSKQVRFRRENVEKVIKAKRMIKFNNY